MNTICHYESPLGGITLACDEQGLTGLWFDGQKYFGAGMTVQDTGEKQYMEGSASKPPAMEQAIEWLEIYFSGRQPGFIPPLHLKGSAFRCLVWEILLKIPYGQTTTYKEIAGEVAERKGIGSMSAQAVGGAVGHNPVSIIVPCHRVLGSDGSMTGYAGGVDKKIGLLTLEKAVISV